ncbi:hypothetical protein ACFRAR_20040 [Kitasatospora sp. NPDC056651]|uniref:hypothetical protein n=1 Tax=Kitasatospora sp. NPDC056651 TaxID=3345892 RepID=UPI00367882D1
MTALAQVARLSTDGGQPVDRLVVHPRLPLAAGAAKGGRVVRIWGWDGEGLREVGSVELGPAAEWGAADQWRAGAVPPMAWHPERAVLVVADAGSLAWWEPDGPPVRERVAATYHHLAFSPDGHALWAKPAGEVSDGRDLGSGAVVRGPYWDTGVGVHPSGDLVATLVSDQSATFCVFARPGTVMRQVRHALVLVADGYDTPLFSADGRHLAVRGNAYADSLDVFAFPSLRRVLTRTLAEDPSEAWPCDNLAWDAARSGVMWIGTSTGSLLELDVETRETTEHPSPTGAPISLLAAVADGELLVADANGGLALLALTRAAEVPAGSTGPADDVAEFLAGTEELPSAGELEDLLVFADGNGAWESEERDSGGEAAP